MCGVWRQTFVLLALLAMGSVAAAATDIIFVDGFDIDPGSLQITSARAAPDGAVSLPISSVRVTYVKPALGNEVAGFFIQSQVSGPALFVAVDPATLAPAPQPGDRISLTVTAMGTTTGALRQATSVSAYVREVTGLPPDALVKDVSANGDLVNSLDNYESESIALSGVLATTFAAAGPGHLSAQLSTPGVIADPNLVLRTPATLVDALDLVQSCTITLGNVPMWRFNAMAQPSPYYASDFTLLDCPAPTVVSAQALASTSVRVHFDRHIAPASVVANGTQFVFNGGLVALGATASGRDVIVTTSAQTSGANYTVTVAGSVTDVTGKGVAAGADSAAFLGFQTRAQLLLNEINPGITSSRDLVELRALTGGSVAGVQLVSDPAAGGGGTVLATLPSLMVVSGDLIVVHLAPISETDESSLKTQCTDAACYPAAWDVRGGATGITYSNRVLGLRSPLDSSLLDAVPFWVNTSTASFPGAVQYIQSVAQWLPSDCAGSPCTYVTVPSVVDIAVSWAGLGTTPGGASVSRHLASDSNQNGDWQIVAASSFGAANP